MSQSKTAAERAKAMWNYLHPVPVPTDPESVKLWEDATALMAEADTKNLTVDQALRQARVLRSADQQGRALGVPNERQWNDPGWQMPVDPESLLLHNRTMELMRHDSSLDYGHALSQARARRAEELAQRS